MLKEQYIKNSPHYHLINIKSMLNDIIDFVREEGEELNEPKIQDLFQTTAEILQDLVVAYDSCESAAEQARQT